MMTLQWVVWNAASRMAEQLYSVQTRGHRGMFFAPLYSVNSLFARLKKEQPEGPFLVFLVGLKISQKNSSIAVDTAGAVSYFARCKRAVKSRKSLAPELSEERSWGNGFLSFIGIRIQ